MRDISKQESENRPGSEITWRYALPKGHFNDGTEESILGMLSLWVQRDRPPTPEGIISPPRGEFFVTGGELVGTYLHDQDVTTGTADGAYSDPYKWAHVQLDLLKKYEEKVRRWVESITAAYGKWIARVNTDIRDAAQTAKTADIGRVENRKIIERHRCEIPALLRGTGIDPDHPQPISLWTMLEKIADKLTARADEHESQLAILRDAIETVRSEEFDALVARVDALDAATPGRTELMALECRLEQVENAIPNTESVQMLYDTIKILTERIDALEAQEMPAPVQLDTLTKRLNALEGKTFNCVEECDGNHERLNLHAGRFESLVNRVAALEAGAVLNPASEIVRHLTARLDVLESDVSFKTAQVNRRLHELEEYRENIDPQVRVLRGHMSGMMRRRELVKNASRDDEDEPNTPREKFYHDQMIMELLASHDSIRRRVTELEIAQDVELRKLRERLDMADRRFEQAIEPDLAEHGNALRNIVEQLEGENSGLAALRARVQQLEAADQIDGDMLREYVNVTDSKLSELDTARNSHRAAIERQVETAIELSGDIQAIYNRPAALEERGAQSDTTAQILAAVQELHGFGVIDGAAAQYIQDVARWADSAYDPAFLPKTAHYLAGLVEALSILVRDGIADSDNVARTLAQELNLTPAQKAAFEQGNFKYDSAGLCLDWLDADTDNNDFDDIPF